MDQEPFIRPWKYYYLKWDRKCSAGGKEKDQEDEKDQEEEG